MVFDVAGAVCIFECVKSFLDVVFDGTDASNKKSKGISTYRILEKTSKFGVTVGNMCGVFGFGRITEGGDYVSKSMQTGIDGDSFFYSFADGRRSFELEGVIVIRIIKKKMREKSGNILVQIQLNLQNGICW